LREVIADTSVLQYLHQTSHLHLLPALYGSILVAAGVAEEIETGRHLGHDLPDLDNLDWLQISPVPFRKSLRLATQLGKGERETLALAAEGTDVLALLDDRAARQAADHLGIPHTGTLGILLRARAACHLDAVRPVIDQLEALEFRLHPALRAAVLKAAGET
jgi:predicted nucleic acid-binding protein